MPGAVALRVLVLAGLLSLLILGLVVHSALPLGPLRMALTYGIAALQIALVLLGFMQFASGPVLTRVAALGAGIWLSILFGFTALDYLYR